MSREFTLFLAIIILDVLLGALCLAIARSERGSPALRFWGQGLLLCTLGFMLILLSSTRLSRVAGFSGNSMLAWVPVLFIRGVLSYTMSRVKGVQKRMIPFGSPDDSLADIWYVIDKGVPHEFFPEREDMR